MTRIICCSKLVTYSYWLGLIIPMHIIPFEDGTSQVLWGCQYFNIQTRHAGVWASQMVHCELFPTQVFVASPWTGLKTNQPQKLAQNSLKSSGQWVACRSFFLSFTAETTVSLSRVSMPLIIPSWKEHGPGKTCGLDPVELVTPHLKKTRWKWWKSPAIGHLLRICSHPNKGQTNVEAGVPPSCVCWFITLYNPHELVRNIMLYLP